MNPDDRDTLPPTEDPLMAIAERLEGKIDRLTSIATACFSKLMGHEMLLQELDDRIRAVETIPPHTNGNGSIVPDAE